MAVRRRGIRTGVCHRVEVITGKEVAGRLPVQPADVPSDPPDARIFSMPKPIYDHFSPATDEHPAQPRCPDFRAPTVYRHARV